MRKFFGNIKNLLLKHKLLAAIVILTLLLIIILFIMLFSMLITTSNKYGSRLDGIKEVEIKKSTLKEIEEKIEKNDIVSNADVHIKGKIVYFYINLKNGTDKKKAKELGNGTLEYFDKDELAFYDLEYILVEDKNKEKGKEKEESTYIITGTKHNTLNKITWSKS